MTLIEALVPAAIQKRTGLWESQEQDLWAHLMRMLQIQGFTDHQGACWKGARDRARRSCFIFGFVAGGGSADGGGGGWYR